MTTANRHIEEYLDYYCELDAAPEYAILLKGPWGAGKSWFVAKYSEKLKDRSHKTLYVSLYGVSTLAEVEDSFFQQLHPVLSHKAMAITGKILKGVLKTSLQIDLNSDKIDKIDIKSQLPDIDIPNYLKDTSKCILIFDDLERCNIPIETILGYINHFVEHQGIKAIIVANEDEILKREKEPETETSFKRIKEKLIGKTFEVMPDLDNALADFIDKVSDEHCRNFLRKKSMPVKELFVLSKYNNLRHLKQTIWDFERIFKVIPEKAKSTDPLILDLAKILSAVSFEIKAGKMKPQDINKIQYEYFGMSLGEEKEGSKSSLKKIMEKYTSIDMMDLLLTESCWIDFFDKGIINREEIEESLLNSKYFQDENTPNWMKLWHLYNLSDDEFAKLIIAVEKDFHNRRYDEIGIIKHITGLFLKLSDLGLYKKEKKLILKEGKEYIDHLKSNKKLAIERKDKWTDVDQYAGLGFSAKEFAEFQELCKYIREKTEEAKIENMQEVEVKLLEIMRNDTDKFYRMVCLGNSDDAIYYETPIFKYINLTNFVETLLSLDAEKRGIIEYVFKERYKHEHLNKTLVDELEWLKELSKTLSIEQNKRIGKLSGYLLKAIISRHVDDAIAKLERLQDSKKTDTVPG